MEQRQAKNIFRSLGRTYGTFFLAMIIFLVAASLLLSARGPLSDGPERLVLIQKVIGIGLAIVFIPLAYGYPQRQIRKVQPDWKLDLKVGIYRQAVVLRLAIVASVFLVNAIFFLVTGDNDLLLVLAIILVFFILSRPTPFRAAADMGLSEEEKLQLM
jgi:tellurite resistance protein TehA-like permease